MSNDFTGCLIAVLLACLMIVFSYIALRQEPHCERCKGNVLTSEMFPSGYAVFKEFEVKRHEMFISNLGVQRLYKSRLRHSKSF